MTVLLISATVTRTSIFVSRHLGTKLRLGCFGFRRFGKFDYAVEMKNASLSSRPESWDLTQVGFENPTFSGRVGVRPNAMWNLGFSGSVGPYLRPEAASSLLLGHSIGDYREILLGQDLSFAWHHFQLWAEVFEARFEVPNVGNADIFSYYIEGKYKITPQLFVALRWNQQLFGTVPDDDEQMQWGNDISRIDAVVGYRFTNYLQVKLQYSLTHQIRPDRKANILSPVSSR